MKQFTVSFTSFIIVFILLIAAKIKVSSVQLKPQLTVELPLGKLEGEERASLHGRKIYAFKGVPYAAPPTGQNRFREPQEVENWAGTKLVNSSTPKCLQLSENTAPMPPYKVEGDEDCLVLNIYSSNLHETANLEVIVTINGVGFMYGADDDTGPLLLFDEEVVFVSINYRLGPLGFLSTEDETVSGNMGMLDQIMALKFVKKYIKYFGGNPKSVTLVGDSSGGSSVHFHLLSPLSKGLFERAVSFSGTMLNSWALVENSRQKAEKLAALLDCSRISLQESVSCLRTKPAADIVATVQAFLPWMYTPRAPFGIVVDSWAKNPTLPEHPLRLIQQGKVQNLPWIVSHTNSEGLLPGCDYYYNEILDQIDTRWNEIIPNLLDFKYTVKASLHDSVSQKIRDYYMGNKRVGNETYMDFVQILTDRLYVGDIVKTVKVHLENVPESKIQLYFFTYRGAESHCNKRTGTYEDFGASGIDDVGYVLNSMSFDASTTEQDREMIKVMVKMLVSFARDGKANIGMNWPMATKEKLHRLHISGPKKLKIDTEVFSNASFWDSLPIRENEKLFFQSDKY